jgi:hypothetical protein
VSEKSFLLPDEVDFIGDIFVFMIVRWSIIYFKII